MNSRNLIALAAAFPLFGALAGIATADSLFPENSAAPDIALVEEERAPASVTITVHTPGLAHTIAYLEEGAGFTVPVYFTLNDASITPEANLALIALVDEVAAAPSVTVTVSAQGQGIDEGAALRDMRAINVFDRLNELGIPDRAMALELDQGPGASIYFDVSSSNAI